GVILAPICVSFLNIPIHTAAGAVLFANFATSLAGVAFYTLIPINGQTAPPDLILGSLFGIGGLGGMYLGAKFQKHLPEPLIKGGLAFIILLVAGRYIIQFFF
ncbi:MAG: sulfite exporter TauE/SafE family protein, partial [Desulfobulbaceae bacterium]|nr:sulfite exporter TauE/SafE family protein [Desulfobulbaceae bacterium]